MAVIDLAQPKPVMDTLISFTSRIYCHELVQSEAVCFNEYKCNGVQRVLTLQEKLKNNTNRKQEITLKNNAGSEQ